jgi:hypothetical protein
MATPQRRVFGRAFAFPAYTSRMKLIIASVALLLSPLAFAQTEQPIKTTLCDIKAHPENYQHKLVEFTTVASHGFEDSMVEDATCAWTKNNNPGVWLDFGGKAKTDTMYCCGPTIGATRPDILKVDGIELPLVDDDVFEQFNARLHPQHSPKRDSVYVRATMRGVVFAQYVGIMGTNGTPKRWSGYGHMGCCMLFVVTQVVGVDPAKIEPPLR